MPGKESEKKPLGRQKDQKWREPGRLGEGKEMKEGGSQDSRGGGSSSIQCPRIRSNANEHSQWGSQGRCRLKGLSRRY